MENSETTVWFDFALACEYINSETYAQMMSRNEEIGSLLNDMLRNPGKYGPRK